MKAIEKYMPEMQFNILSLVSKQRLTHNEILKKICEGDEQNKSKCEALINDLFYKEFIQICNASETLDTLRYSTTELGFLIYKELNAML